MGGIRNSVGPASRCLRVLGLAAEIWGYFWEGRGAPELFLRPSLDQTCRTNIPFLPPSEVLLGFVPMCVPSHTHPHTSHSPLTCPHSHTCIHTHLPRVHMLMITHILTSTCTYPHTYIPICTSLHTQHTILFNTLTCKNTFTHIVHALHVHLYTHSPSPYTYTLPSYSLTHLYILAH